MRRSEREPPFPSLSLRMAPSQGRDAVRGAGPSRHQQDLRERWQQRIRGERGRMLAESTSEALGRHTTRCRSRASSLSRCVRQPPNATSPAGTQAPAHMRALSCRSLSSHPQFEPRCRAFSSTGSVHSGLLSGSVSRGRERDVSSSSGK